MAKRRPTRRRKARSSKRRPTRRRKARTTKRARSSRKGWATRRKRAKAERLGRRYAEYHAPEDFDRRYPWDADEEWEPPGGWQGDNLSEEISFMTHEEKIEFLEYLAEQLDTTVHELFEMMGSP